MKDSARLYLEKYLDIEAEHSASRIRATEEALAILLREEKQLSLKKNYKFVLLAIVIFITLLSVTDTVHRQSVKERKKKESEVSELKQKLNNTVEEIIELARKNDSSFLLRFKNIYPKFTHNLLTRHPDMTESELQLSAMIFLNFPSKEIAKYLFMTHRSVQTKKNRLRRKLNLPSGADLYQYFKSLS